MGIVTICEKYLDVHNKRLWQQLSDYVNPELIYNGKSLSLDKFRELQAEETQLMPGLSMTMAHSIQIKGVNELGVGVRSTGTLSRPSWGLAATTEPFQFWRHLICRFRDDKLSEIYVITNIAEIQAGRREIDIVPELLTQPPEPPVNLAQHYRAYISCINSRTMDTELHKFCHPVVTWNGEDLALEKYRMLMEDSFDAISGLSFDVKVLVEDIEQQALAVRIEFKGIPVKKYADAEPTGKSVEFAEHAFYWLDHGKIKRVQTMIDWETYKEQLRG